MLHRGRGGSRQSDELLPADGVTVPGNTLSQTSSPPKKQQTIEGVEEQGVAPLCASLLKKQLYKLRIKDLKMEE